ncbi:MAG: DUF423 domain-containing protein [Magnetococcales bacterium]|nr:DUF423 domain-containing protein [Magnetococcales bacterium]
MTLQRLLGSFGAVNAALAVALGAYGAHVLKGDAVALNRFSTANDYQMWHALGLIMMARLVTSGIREGALAWAGALLTAGILLFCGNLYLLSLVEWTPWGALTPLGGFCLIAGWLMLAWGFLRS